MPSSALSLLGKTGKANQQCFDRQITKVLFNTQLKIQQKRWAMAKKTFVLDTNVILHDYECIYSFEDNDIVLPITVLEELDQFKRGSDQINFNAREFIRILDTLSGDKIMKTGTKINPKGGKIRIITDHLQEPAVTGSVQRQPARPPHPERGLLPVQEAAPAKWPGRPGLQGREPAPEGQVAGDRGPGLFHRPRPGHRPAVYRQAVIGGCSGRHDLADSTRRRGDWTPPTSACATCSPTNTAS